jgi:hypothetical protein
MKLNLILDKGNEVVDCIRLSWHRDPVFSCELYNEPLVAVYKCGEFLCSDERLSAYKEDFPSWIVSARFVDLVDSA